MKRLPSWFALLPALVPLGFFLGSAVVFTAWEARGAYAQVWSTPGFRESLVFSAKVGFFSAAISTTLALILSLSVVRPFGQRGLWSRPLDPLLYLPLILPPVAVGYLTVFWLGSTGMIARFADFFGFEFRSPLFRGDGWGIILAYIYKETPFGLLFLVPVVQAFPRPMISTALGLGASRARVFWTLLFPRLLPALGSVFLILFIFTFGAYDIPFVVGESSPSMVSQYLYRAYFVSPLNQRPLAAAGLVILFGLSLGVVVGYSYLAAYLDERERTL